MTVCCLYDFGLQYDYVNISFWYIPPSLRGREETPEWWQELGKVSTHRTMAFGSLYMKTNDAWMRFGAMPNAV